MVLLFYVAAKNSWFVTVIQFPELSEQVVDQYQCRDSGEEVRAGESQEHAFDTHEQGEDIYQGHQEEQLPAQGEENGFPDHAEALEEIG